MSHFVHDDSTDHNDMTTISTKAVENPLFGHTLERS